MYDLDKSYNPKNQFFELIFIPKQKFDILGVLEFKIAQLKFQKYKPKKRIY